MLQLFQNNYGQEQLGYAIEFLPLDGLPVEEMPAKSHRDVYCSHRMASSLQSVALVI